MSMISRQKLIEELNGYHFTIIGMRCGKKVATEIIQEYHDHVIEVIESQPPADQWIPCSSGRVPKHEQKAFITLELIKGRRYVTTAKYYTKTGVVDDYEWTGEGFYSYDSEYGWDRHDDVIAWMPAEPYKGVE